MDMSPKRIVIATHALVYGAPQALREYWRETSPATELVWIAHPLIDDGSRSIYERAVDGRVTMARTAFVHWPVNVVNYLTVVWLNLWWGCHAGRIDVWFGVNPLNALVGIWLKRLGRVQQVVYYTIDYVPSRFANRWLNSFYHAIDGYCVRRADVCWNVSAQIATARERYQKLSPTAYPQTVVPIGVWYKRVKRLPVDQIKPHQILFVGNLLAKQGVQLAIDALALVRQNIPDATLVIVGGGEYEATLRAQVQVQQLTTAVTFHGWVKDRAVLDNLMADSAVAVALYDRAQDTFTAYADPTKLKDYLSAGLPIVMTDVPHNAQELAARGCAVVVPYEVGAVAQNLLELLSDRSRLEQARDAALAYAQTIDWSIIFTKALAGIKL